MASASVVASVEPCILHCMFLLHMQGGDGTRQGNKVPRPLCRCYARHAVRVPMPLLVWRPGDRGSVKTVRLVPGSCCAFCAARGGHKTRARPRHLFPRPAPCCLTPSFTSQWPVGRLCVRRHRRGSPWRARQPTDQPPRLARQNRLREVRRGLPAATRLVCMLLNANTTLPPAGGLPFACAGTCPGGYPKMPVHLLDCFPRSQPLAARSTAAPRPCICFVYEGTLSRWALSTWRGGAWGWGSWTSWRGNHGRGSRGGRHTPRASARADGWHACLHNPGTDTLRGACSRVLLRALLGEAALASCLGLTLLATVRASALRPASARPTVLLQLL